MKKLVSYRYKAFVPFGDGEYKIVYEMTIAKSYFFGLFKKTYCIDYALPMHASIGAHIAHWDFLVSSGAEVK